MNATTAEPLTRDVIDQFLNQLTPEQQKYVFAKLFAPILGPIKERREFVDTDGNFFGDYAPFPKVQPGQKVGMSDEAREAISKMKRMTREEWKAEQARQQASASSEPNTCETESNTVPTHSTN